MMLLQQQLLQNQRRTLNYYFSSREENCKYYSYASNNCYRSRNMTSIQLGYDIVTSYGRRANVVSTLYVY